MRLGRELLAGVAALAVAGAATAGPPVTIEDLEGDGVAVAQAVAVAKDGTRAVATAVAGRGATARTVVVADARAAGRPAQPNTATACQRVALEDL